jgi:hypothetical protein
MCTHSLHVVHAQADPGTYKPHRLRPNAVDCAQLMLTCQRKLAAQHCAATW